jgi:predicted dehydrogenase
MNSALRPFGIGVIGTGKHGSRYASHLCHDLEHMTLKAISRRSDEGRRQAEAWNCRWYGDWRQLVEDPEVAAVVVAVPPVFNLEIARACAAAGKPLLLEKPMAGNVEEAQAILALTGKAGLSVTIAQTLRYNPVIGTLRQQLADIGQLFSFAATQRLEPSTLAWHEQPEFAGAGVSFHTAVHVFDALRFITGLEVSRVMASARQIGNHCLEDLLVVLVEMENGVIGTVDCSKVSHARSGKFEFVGAEGQLHGEQIYGACEIIRQLERTPVDPGRPVNTIVPLLVDWHAYLCGRRANPVPGRDGLAAVMICEACLRSAQTGQWVTV